MDLDHLPTILEIKRTLAGRRKEFQCRLAEHEPGHAVVLFISPATYRVGGLCLPPGTVTLGHFWQDRDYNVYHWLTPEGSTVAHYFNLAAETSIHKDTISWCDLALDVLVRPHERPVVLDEDELPEDLDPPTRQHIENACQQVVAAHAAITRALEDRADVLWPRLFGVRRP